MLAPISTSPRRPAPPGDRRRWHIAFLLRGLMIPLQAEHHKSQTPDSTARRPAVAAVGAVGRARGSAHSGPFKTASALDPNPAAQQHQAQHAKHQDKPQDQSEGDR